MGSVESRLEKLERRTEARAGATGVIIYDPATGEPRPGGNAADLIRAWRDGVTTLWLPDNGRERAEILGEQDQ